MNLDYKIRWLIIITVVFASAYYIYPTIKYYGLSTNNSIEKLSSEEKLRLEKQSINLGLDLKGGIHIVLKPNAKELIRKLANKRYPALDDLLELSKKQSKNSNKDFFTIFQSIVDEQEIRLVEFFAKLKVGKENIDIINRLKQEYLDVLNSSIEILNNRVNSFGVSEPNIQKIGNNKIVVELAGVTDFERAMSFLQKTAVLEFSLVINERLPNLLEKIDKKLLANNSIRKDSQSLDKDDDLFKNFNIENQDSLDFLKKIKEFPFSGYFEIIPTPYSGFSSDNYFIEQKSFEAFKALLSQPEVQSLIPLDKKLVWGKSEFIEFEEGNPIEVINIYYVYSKPIVSGEGITNSKAAQAPIGSDSPGWGVDLSMNKQATKDWAIFTAANQPKTKINQIEMLKSTKLCAIILDSLVYAAPRIMGEIPNGQTRISGNFTRQEAVDLASIIKAGEFRVPLLVEEKQLIGASLGEDSINSGRKSIIIGLTIVLIFMLIYYKGAGLIASISLVLNILIILAVMASIKDPATGNTLFTLTLPGIAGLILTIGMTVDANVIIFERIKEELGMGKTITSALESGYKRAFITIFDANITTLIAGFILVTLGSGPIKGFAYTLSIGIVCSMFTAVFITKTIFLTLTEFFQIKKLSI